MRVLHVVEAAGGGVVTAVLAMVEATPELDHHLVTWPRRSHDAPGDAWKAAFTSVHEIPPAPLRATGALHRVTRELFPDVVHAHSSYAGGLVRGAGLDGPAVVYSPHCFAFERRDLGPASRRLVTRAERVLASRTDLLVAVSPHEVDLAAELGHREIAYVVNRALLPPVDVAVSSSRLHAVTVGRVSPQKDWRSFLHVKRYAEEQLGVDATWEWLGGGDPEGEAALVEAGVAVSGWIPRSELLHRMAGAGVYLHTAAWEGAPISVFEAAALGVPLAVRAIPALTSLDVPGTAATVAALAARVAELQQPRARAAARRASIGFGEIHSVDVQRRQLLAAYDRVVPGVGRRTAPAPSADLRVGLAGAGR